jgi:hypothetical protein
MTISTIYEVSKPTYQFYSVERSGYTDVGTLVTDTVSDMTDQGKFSFKSAKLTDINNFVLDTPEFPILERMIEILDPGIGYRTGNLLEVKLEIGANIKLIVSNVITKTGAISEINVAWPGNYEANVVTSESPSRVASYALDWQPINANLIVANTIASSTQTFQLKGNVTNSIGSPTAIPSPIPSGIVTKTWNTEWGSDGSGGTLGTKWPANGIWFEANIVPGAFTQRIYNGQLIELDTEKINSANSFIPPGTTIVSIVPMKYINGPETIPGTKDVREKLGDGTYLILSNPVTLRKDDTVVFKGIGAQFTNNKKQPPKAWQVTVEAEGAIDPLNDPLGVTGDIRVSGTNSKYIEITSISNAGNGVPYRPRIHEGQAITSTVQNGSIGPGESVYVSAITMDGTGTIANIEMSRSLSNFTAGETLQFRFDQMQPWRMAFDVKENKTKPQAGPQAVVVYAATELQLQDNGNIANIYLAGTGTTFTLTDRSGILGSLPTGPLAAPSVTDPTQGFINREARVQTDPEAYPFNYALTMTDRGIFWGVWEGTWSTMQKTKRIGAGGDSFFNWVLIQRPANRNTGKVLTKGRAPVFCINSVGYQYWKFILREEDVLHPTTGDPQNTKQTWVFSNSTIISQSVPHRVPADANTQDSFAILNTTNQVALTEDSKYLVSFLHNLATPRFRYSEELDIIGQTSADVCMAGTDISITAYNEAGARTYRALPANNPYNTGLRIAVLKDIPQVEP